MKKLILANVVVAALVFAWIAQAGGTKQQALPQAFGVGETATMSGSTEVPPGDPDGTGSALIRLNATEGLVCFELRASNVDPLVAGHIHKGAAGVAGPVVITLVPPSPTTGLSKGCVQADSTLIQDIIANPSQYYVNVHNAAFPSGAIRGQLATLTEAPIKPKVITKTKIVRVHDCKGKKKK
jgi:CHRD domain-containing protein